MKREVHLSQLETYRICPEKSRREQININTEWDLIENKYQRNLRKLLVRYYMELMGGRSMSELELRRAWSLLWKTTPGMISRRFKMNEASVLNATSTEEERYILRGTKNLHAIASRSFHNKIEPVIVDEPFTVKLDNTELRGTWDLVFQDSKKNYWVVIWSNARSKVDTRFDLRFPVVSEAFRERFGSTPKMLVDYILGLGDYLDPVLRTAEQYKSQLVEATNLTQALSQELIWKSIGPSCNFCPYHDDCIGVKIVQSKSKSKQQANSKR